jgi:hypothetical protein
LVSGQWSLVIGEEEESEEAASSSSFSISAFQRFSFYPPTTPIIISRYDDLILEITALGAIFPA